MADTFIQLPDDSANTGKKVRAKSRTVGVNTVHESVVQITDATADNQVAVLTAAPAGTEGGLVTRPIPSGTQAVSGTFWQATQPISAAALPLPAGAALDATLTGGTQQAIIRGGIKGTSAAGTITSQNVDANTQALHTSVTNFPATQPVSGTFWQATQPVSGTFFQATQPVSIAAAVTVAQATAASLNATVVQATAANLNATVTQAAGSSVSLGSSTGKTLVMKTGSLASSATTADQVVLTYTVTAAKTFYLCYFALTARITTFAATAIAFGSWSLEIVSGTKVYTSYLTGPGSAIDWGQVLAEPIPIAAGTVIRIVCTPAAATAFTWNGNFGGYEK